MDTCPDCPTAENLNEPIVKETANLCLQRFNEESRLANYFTLENITKASSQVKTEKEMKKKKKKKPNAGRESVKKQVEYKLSLCVISSKQVLLVFYSFQKTRPNVKLLAILSD